MLGCSPNTLRNLKTRCGYFQNMLRILCEYFQNMIRILKTNYFYNMLREKCTRMRKELTFFNPIWKVTIQTHCGASYGPRREIREVSSCQYTPNLKNWDSSFMNWYSRKQDSFQQLQKSIALIFPNFVVPEMFRMSWSQRDQYGALRF